MGGQRPSPGLGFNNPVRIRPARTSRVNIDDGVALMH